MPILAFYFAATAFVTGALQAHLLRFLETAGASESSGRGAHETCLEPPSRQRLAGSLPDPLASRVMPPLRIASRSAALRRIVQRPVCDAGKVVSPGFGITPQDEMIHKTSAKFIFNRHLSWLMRPTNGAFSSGSGC